MPRSSGSLGARRAKGEIMRAHQEGSSRLRSQIKSQHQSAGSWTDLPALPGPGAGEGLSPVSSSGEACIGRVNLGKHSPALLCFTLSETHPCGES